MTQNPNWRNPIDDFPDWKEGGKCEFLYRDGTVVTGFIDFDVGFDGEDEYPIPEVTLDDGSKVLFTSMVGWRQLK